MAVMLNTNLISRISRAVVIACGAVFTLLLITALNPVGVKAQGDKTQELYASISYKAPPPSGPALFLDAGVEQNYSLKKGLNPDSPISLTRVVELADEKKIGGL